MDTEDVLEAVAADEMGVAEARDRLRGIGRRGETVRVDTEQGARTGIPEVVEAERKTVDELVDISEELLAGTGRAVIADIDDEARERLAALADDATWYERSRTLVLHEASHEVPETTGTVGFVTAGTADAAVAERGVVLAEELGCETETVYDVGVSGIRRLLSEMDRLADCDAVVVAAGREGALATVVAGLVSAPVIGVPVGTGSGHGGDGEAALAGMLQSCTYLTVVNIDAGFRAGAQAALIAQ